MSAYPGSFRWCVGTADAPREAVTDATMDQVQPPSTMKLSGHALKPETQADALRLKNEILAMVAYELRGPLTPLQFATNLIRRASADRVEVLRSVDMIDRQVTQISRLADDLVDAMRVERGALRVFKISVDIVAVLAAPLAAAALAVVLRKQILTGRFPIERCAPTAIPFASHRHIGSLMPHIFKLFSQASRAIAASAGGLGAGLAVVKAVAESHGGTVSVSGAGSGLGSESTL